jgi:hypothetical protein
VTVTQFFRTLSKSSVEDPDPGFGAFLTPGSGIRIQDSDPGLTTRIIFPRAYKTIFWVKVLKFFDAYPGSGMEKIRIRDLG